MLNSDRSLKPPDRVGRVIALDPVAAFAMACQGEDETPAKERRSTRPDSRASSTPTPAMAKAEKPADTPVPALAKVPAAPAPAAATPEMAKEDTRSMEGDMYGGTYNLRRNIPALGHQSHLLGRL